MRLPQIQYNRQLPSLGRGGTTEPIRIESIRAQSRRGIVDAFSEVTDNITTAYYDNALAGAKAGLIEEMGRINAEISSKRFYTADELSAIGVDAGGRPMVAAHEVAVDVYSRLSEQAYDKAASQVHGRGRLGDLRLNYAAYYRDGINKAIVSRNKNQVAFMAAKTNQQFEDAVNAGNIEGATVIAEAAVNTGVWDPDQYASATVDLPYRVRKNQYVVGMGQASSAGQMEQLKSQLLADPALRNEDRHQLLSQMNSQIRGFKQEARMAAIEARQMHSQQMYADLATSMMMTGPKDWTDVGEAMKRMEPGDAKSLFTINRSLIDANTGSAFDNEDTVRGLQAEIRALSIPVEGMSIAERRSILVDRLYLALGVDPVTGAEMGEPQIKTETFDKLFRQINGAGEFNYDNAEVKIVEDYIWTMMTGGTKSSFGGIFDEAGPHAILAAEAEYELKRAAQATGPGFDPHQWWETNKQNYISKNIQDNIDQARKMTLSDGQSANSHIVRDDEGKVNQEKTRQNVEDKMRSGDLTVEDAAQTLDAAAGHENPITRDTINKLKTKFGKNKRTDRMRKLFNRPVRTHYYGSR